MIDILLVEDNEELGGLLVDFLKAEGYSVHLSRTGEEGEAYFLSEGARLVVLDIMLPGMDGFAVCRSIRMSSNAPIIIVSAKIEKEDKLNGLLLGADDYVEKPYDIDILLAKIGGIFKRRYESDVLICGDIRLDKTRRAVYKKDELIQTTAKEFDLLLLLVENAGKALSKDMIFNKIWGFDSFSEPQTLTVHIKRLREKIEELPKAPMHIQTVWGVGYRFEE
ncbi:response regulator transcription factor [Bariatricus massiliensis]|uniref:Stage 0 sporulation protein A homolog n=1 Tax=Bariatricus massiliensis TaxID=1745713 RepID=A0ABS8DDW5_9FIRM|nr:response regulator transcription factor [Bariatricus massiliensis]MCB7302715.1 response regulator transcription factor [Bariatricus massiliensis]MCB7373931.1 response regulator transcription factor [Bariatricus massiliensis]MCB7386601.1 response regulator transcription factor [Bariatricus massiliensis]MCB7410763.1 response regulator transcription factor [Bariatricus massiliensis]MCQ5253398.1 response regulator transcription factor [Bariatricus massiliensis]